MTTVRPGTSLAVIVALATALSALPSSARPFYFDTLTTFYGYMPGDDLYACGVCHRRWEGTGARNPYGLAIEQQLYLGKSITDAILSVELVDTDLDGFDNGDELATHGTLPGYSCDTFDLVINPPANFQSLIEPFVATCLEPKDLKVTPLLLSFSAELGTMQTLSATLINNGSVSPIVVSDLELVPPHATLSINAPALPLAIPVGSSAAVNVTFEPATTSSIMSTLRITSDDPDEPTIDVPVSAAGFFVPLATKSVRAACLGTVTKRLQKYSKTYFKEWARCYVDEAFGRACDVGRRDLKVEKAEEKFRSFVGGERDKDCDGLTASLLGLAETCGGSCDYIDLNTITDIADCLVCQQEAAMSAMLSATMGVTPPDLPTPAASSLAAKCQKQLNKGLEKGITKIHKILAACELENITATTPVDCEVANAAEIAKIQEKAISRFDKCKDTTGLEGCPFEVGADASCLGDASLTIADDLVDTTFGIE